MQIVQYEDVTWVDFLNPNDKDIRYIQENFDVHPLAIEEFVTPTYRARATQYSNCLFLTIHVPLFDRERRTTYAGEIDILLTPTHLVTGHRHEIYQLSSFMENLLTSTGKQRIYMSDSPAKLLYEIMKLLVESCFSRLDHVTENIDDIQEHIFNGNERNMVREISIVKRDVLNFRRTLMPQRTILESILSQKGNIVPEHVRPYLQDLIATNVRLWNMLESAKETIASLEETNNSLLDTKINTNTRILTIFSATIIPMTVYANILGINARTPLGEHPLGFWIHVLIMGGISVLTILLFRILRWI